MHICRTVSHLRSVTAEVRARTNTSALVPTMGALHDGHLALVAHAAQQADAVVTSIFVNPTQFGAGEDLDRYPRQEETDLALLRSAGVTAVFAPSVGEMYSPNDATRIDMTGPALGLEADHRPHFFCGVATIVSRLLLAAQCDYAVFGEKDYQQLLVIKRMVDDLHIPVVVQGVATVRESDGLALSSRNAYLTSHERAVAPRFYRTLQEVHARLVSGVSTDEAQAWGTQELQSFGFNPDYFAVRHAHTLARYVPGQPGRILAAAFLGSTRLIDNIAI